MQIINTFSRDIYANAIKSGLSLALSQYINKENKTHLIIAQDAALSQQLYQELQYLLPKRSILYFNDLEILPFDHFSASEDIISSRLSTLYQLQQNKNTIVIVSANTLLKLLPPPSFLLQQSFVVKIGDTIDLADKKRRLEMHGYHCVHQVLSRGEFSVRGSILDIFPMGADMPYRIDLFDDEIDSIRSFDIETQRSQDPINSVSILPTQELNFTKDSQNHFAEKYFDYFQHIDTNNEIYQQINKQVMFNGIEFYLDLFYPKLASLFDYLDTESIIHQVHHCTEGEQRYYDSIQQRHDQLKHDRLRPILAIDKVYLSPQKLSNLQKNFKTIKWLDKEKSKSTTLPIQKINDIHVHYQYKEPYKKLLNFLDQQHFDKIIFCTDGMGRREVLIEQLHKIHIHPKIINHICDIEGSLDKHFIVIAPFREGVILRLDNQSIAIITEFDLFPNHLTQGSAAQKTTSKQQHPNVAIKDLSELSLDNPVVHIEHGIARYKGLSKLQIGAQETEFLTLSFKNDETLYVPIHSLHLVSRYSGTELDRALISKLGNDTWDKQKEKALKKITDVAADLLEVYAQRSMKKGFGNVMYEKDYLAFSEGFPFEETADQAAAINDVLKDMIATKPMDRLVCGDVGFGKTEVAMRAAFLAISNNKQVAILAPTTLLAQQHFENFSDRFSDSGAHVDVLSRFKSTTQQNEAIHKINNGTIDIIIGTHKLLSEKIKFHNLGLLIIDEEHRFGVTQKEKMKTLRANIDILTMTATPIPRTLNMAFSQVRDLSVIATPPAKRLSVRTFVKEHNISIVREAIMRESLRGGQVYYLHNEVSSIYDKAEQLQKVFPQLKIAVAHGQMRERELEKIMFDFQQNRYQVLVCTTIIETGIDIANANTIIIERADKFGLAQLHQLRGRVGRSHHQAYAYLLTPEIVSLQKDAKKRLEAINETQSLGGGYMLANHDLEIRGAGELLGKEQSGNMQGIGFNLYMELLQKTIKALQKGEKFDSSKITQSLSNSAQIELRIPALFPEEYIFDVHSRLGIYKRLSSAQDTHEVNQIKIEVIDRFGPLPDYANHLFAITYLKLKAQALGIHKIELHSAGGRIEFSQPLSFDPMILIRLVQLQPTDFQLSQEQKLLIKKKLSQAEERIRFIDEFLDKINQKQSQQINKHA